MIHDFHAYFEHVLEYTSGEYVSPGSGSPSVCLCVRQAGRPQKPVAAVFVFMAEQQTAYEEKFPGVDRKDLTRLMINDFEKLSTAKQVGGAAALTLPVEGSVYVLS